MINYIFPVTKYLDLASKLSKAVKTVECSLECLMDGGKMTRDEAFKVIINEHWPKAPKVKTVVSPKNKAELCQILAERKIDPAKIDVSNVKDFSLVFMYTGFDNWSFLKNWNLQYLKVDTTNGIKFTDAVDSVTGMFAGSNINDTARFGNWFSEWPLAIWIVYHFSKPCNHPYATVRFNPKAPQAIQTTNCFDGLDYSTRVDVTYIPRIRMTSSLDCLARLSFDRMFMSCVQFSGVGTGIKNWCLSGGVSFNSMFSDCVSFRADVSQWGIGMGHTRPGSFWHMFHNCPKFNSKLTTWLIRWDSDFDRAFERGTLDRNPPLIWNIHDATCCDKGLMGHFLN